MSGDGGPFHKGDADPTLLVAISWFTTVSVVAVLAAATRPWQVAFALLPVLLWSTAALPLAVLRAGAAFRHLRVGEATERRLRRGIVTAAVLLLGALVTAAIADEPAILAASVPLPLILAVQVSYALLRTPGGDDR